MCTEKSEVAEARVPVVECFECRARITSKELAPIHSVKKWHPPECLFYKSENGCRFGEQCSYAHRQVEEQPGKKSNKNGDKNAVAMLHDNWIAYFRTWSRRSVHRFHGRAQKYGNQSDVLNSQKPSYVMLTFETKIHRLE